MIPRLFYWRAFTRDRIFLVLFVAAIMSFIIALVKHDPKFEHSTVALQLGITFFIINLLFSAVCLRREPLLSYMFLTATLLANGTMYFFFNYLASLQT